MLAAGTLMSPRKRAPYHIWSTVEESQVQTWVAQERSLAEIAMRLNLPRRRVREKLRRMGLKAVKAKRGPCDCETCPVQAACLQAIIEWRPLPREECDHAWPERPSLLSA